MIKFLQKFLLVFSVLFFFSLIKTPLARAATCDNVTSFTITPPAGDTNTLFTFNGTITNCANQSILLYANDPSGASNTFSQTVSTDANGNFSLMLTNTPFSIIDTWIILVEYNGAQIRLGASSLNLSINNPGTLACGVPTTSSTALCPSQCPLAPLGGGLFQCTQTITAQYSDIGYGRQDQVYGSDTNVYITLTNQSNNFNITPDQPYTFSFFDQNNKFLTNSKPHVSSIGGNPPEVTQSTLKTTFAFGQETFSMSGNQSDQWRYTVTDSNNNQIYEGFFTMYNPIDLGGKTTFYINDNFPYNFIHPLDGTLPPGTYPPNTNAQYLVWLNGAQFGTLFQIAGASQGEANLTFNIHNANSNSPSATDAGPHQICIDNPYAWGSYGLVGTSIQTTYNFGFVSAGFSAGNHCKWSVNIIGSTNPLDASGATIAPLPPPCILYENLSGTPIAPQDTSNLTGNIPTHCAEVLTGIGQPLNTDPLLFIGKIAAIILSLTGGIAIIIIMISGYRIMTSQGNPEALQGAREMLTSAIVGLLFSIFSIVILEIVGVDILKIPGFGH